MKIERGLFVREEKVPRLTRSLHAECEMPARGGAEFGIAEPCREVALAGPANQLVIVPVVEGACHAKQATTATTARARGRSNTKPQSVLIGGTD